ncbi:transposase [Hymenobacter psoromatis]|uniref:transposase n=1 Tax=Hymenobacter psoromatis TaxID=1484116 RepID=UPI001CC1AD24|nr:transposase [Hymenobacter psoromatis]
MSPARLDYRAGPRPGRGQPKKSRVGDEARGGPTTKIHALVDALGNPLRLLPGPGQQADCQRAADLLLTAQGVGNVLADKGCDTDAVVAAVEALSAQLVIPSEKNSQMVRLIDRNMYRDAIKSNASSATSSSFAA